MTFLDSLGRIGRDSDQLAAELGQPATGAAGQTQNPCSAASGGFRGQQDIRRIAAGADGDEYVFRTDERLDLPKKCGVVVVIVAPAGKGRSIHEMVGGKPWPVSFVPCYEFFHQMHCIAGGTPVPAGIQATAGTEGLDESLADQLDVIGLLDQLLLHPCRVRQSPLNSVEMRYFRHSACVRCQRRSKRFEQKRSTRTPSSVHFLTGSWKGVEFGCFLPAAAPGLRLPLVAQRGSKAPPTAKARATPVFPAWSWKNIAAAVLLLTSACSSEDTLRPVRSIGIEGSVALDTAMTADDVLWLSAPGRLVALRPSAASAAQLGVPANATAEVLGTAGGNLLFLANRTVLAASPDSSAPFRVAERIEAATLEPETGVLFESITAGEIVAVVVDGFRPAWGWGGVGAPSSALAISPERDRLYQAVAPDDPDLSPTLRVRDLLSGRTLRTVDLNGPIRILQTTTDGDLIGVGWATDGSTAFLTRLSWADGELRTAWRRSVERATDRGRLKLATSADGRRAAVAGANAEAGLTLFDGETGSAIAVFSGAVRDAVFDDRARLYVLTDSVVLRVE